MTEPESLILITLSEVGRKINELHNTQPDNVEFRLGVARSVQVLLDYAMEMVDEIHKREGTVKKSPILRVVQ